MLFFLSFYFQTMFVHLDAAEPWQKHFQDPATPIMEGLIDLHHHIFFFLIVISIFVFWMVYVCIYYFGLYPKNAIIEFCKIKNLVKYMHREKHIVFTPFIYAKLLNKWIYSHKITHNYVLEIIWTLIPTFILIMIAIPSFSLLYAMDEVITPELTLKVIGHQWYWSYEMADLTFGDIFQFFYGVTLCFDSFMIPEDELVLGELRLLEVDNPVILPTDTHIRAIVTSEDVLHSWAIPALGVKMDAVPGRLNQVSIFIKRSGVFYGQCSEICGVHHGFMPIVIKAISPENYLQWVKRYSNVDFFNYDISRVDFCQEDYIAYMEKYNKK